MISSGEIPLIRDTMAGPFGGSSTSKAQGAADALNRFLYNLVLSCVSGAAQL